MKAERHLCSQVSRGNKTMLGRKFDLRKLTEQVADEVTAGRAR
jgi:hypothetical protein